MAEVRVEGERGRGRVQEAAEGVQAAQQEGLVGGEQAPGCLPQSHVRAFR